MRRFVSISWVSLAVIVVAAGVFGLVPAERDRVNSAIHNFSFDAHLKQQAAQRPNDPWAWLALAAAAWPSSERTEAYRRVFKLRPDWAAPYLLAGAAWIRQVPLVRNRELIAAWPDWADRLHRKEGPLTKKQLGAAREATWALEKARALEPGNAAPDYLLACIALGQHRDEEAVALLRSALHKHHWNLGTREASIAAYRANLRAEPALEAAIDAGLVSNTPGFHVSALLRQLARVATALAVLAERRGDHEGAILWRESMIHMGELLAADGYTLIDSLVGAAVWGIAASERLTPAESAAATKGMSRPKSGEGGTPMSQRWTDALRKARYAKAAEHLRRHGRPDLAASIPAFATAERAWLNRVRPIIERQGRQGAALLDSLSLFRQAVAAAGAALALLVVCGLAYGLLAALKRRPTPIIWARWKWAVAVLACAGVAAALAMYRGQWFDWWPGYGWDLPNVPLAAAFLTVGLGLLVVSAGVVTLWVRRRVAAPGRPGFLCQYVGTLTAVLLPLTAVLMIGCLAVSVPLIQGANTEAKRYRGIVYQGEMEYYGLQRPLVGTVGSRGKILQSPRAPSE